MTNETLPKRSLRRHHFQRIKARMRPYVRTWFSGRELVENERLIIHMAETHGVPCSCRGCAHHKDVPPKRERAANAEVLAVAPEGEAK